jgi:hypothetical protein
MVGTGVGRVATWQHRPAALNAVTHSGRFLSHLLVTKRENLLVRSVHLWSALRQAPGLP